MIIYGKTFNYIDVRIVIRKSAIIFHLEDNHPIDPSLLTLIPT